MATSISGLMCCTPQRGTEEWSTGYGRQEDSGFRNLPPRTGLTFRKTKNPRESLRTEMWSQPIGLHLFVTTKEELGFRVQCGPAFPLQSGEGGTARALLWVGKQVPA